MNADARPVRTRYPRSSNLPEVPGQEAAVRERAVRRPLARVTGRDGLARDVDASASPAAPPPPSRSVTCTPGIVFPTVVSARTSSLSSYAMPPVSLVP